MITEHPKETLGAAAMRVLKDYNPDQTVGETKDSMLSGYYDELIKCAKAGETLHGCDSHFYVCVQTKRERHLPNVIRNLFYSRKTRPIPDYDLALYYYEPKDEKLTFVWCIPDKNTVKHFTGYYEADEQGHVRWVPPAVPTKDEEQLAYFCKLFIACSLV